jgi:uncharacterized protein (DUF58 family)
VIRAPLAPATASAVTRKSGTLGVGVGRRTLFLLALGLSWVIPAFWNPRFVYAVLAWDLVVLLAYVLDCFQLPKPAQLTIERTWPAAPSLSNPSEVRLTVRNQGRIAVDGTLLDNLPLEMRQETPLVRLHVSAQRETTGSYAIRPLQRGDLKVGKAYLRYQSAAQLAERWVVADIEQRVRIYPDLEDVKRHSMYLSRSRQIELQKRTLRHRGFGREFESLREYQDGDEFRDICWTATARRGKLVTKLHQIERSQAVWIVVDAGRLLRTRVNELNKLDYTANAALTLAHLAIYSGDRVGLLAYGRKTQQRVPPARGNAHLRQILDQLAVVQPEASEADHLKAASTLMWMQKRRSLVVWLTDLAETSMTPEVIEGASQLLSRHLLLFVVVAQLDLKSMALRRPGTAEQMYETVAAQDMMQRRELLLSRLRERGALALEIAPGKLSTGLVNHYLGIKERSLL